MIKNLFIHKKTHFDPFKKNKVIFILHPPCSSYDTKKNFSKRELHRVHFPKIFLNNYSTKHLKKNLLLKNFKSRLLYEGKSKGSDIENRLSLVLKKLAILKRFANFREENLLFT